MQKLLDSPQLKNICKESGISYLGLFGSHARGDQNLESDVDLLVKFDTPIGYFKLVQTQRKLGDYLGHTVDLVTEGSISPRIYPYVQQDLKTIYDS